jgi:hypothetical protein
VSESTTSQSATTTTSAGRPTTTMMMTSYTSSDTLPRSGVDRGDDAPRGRGGRVGTVIVLVVALVAAAVTRHVAIGFQASHSPAGRRTLASGASLAGMDSYALALLLGGLRGPLVMILWANSESQKADRNLEGIDTQIEWIRRLQPEFDTVHVFQIWNKAYNLSVQMVGLSNKYTTILDALDYAKSVDAERPDNMNILKEIGRVYSEKLGNANPEKYYYRERLRRETRHREVQAPSAAGTMQRSLHDPLLDEKGMLLPQYLAPRPSVKAGKPKTNDEPYDGSELQYLKRFQPFPYGLSPMALGYVYQKRTQVLMHSQDQTPIQVSESVVDSQPALALKGWAEEEWERARRIELTTQGKPIPGERIDLESVTAAAPLDGPLKDSPRYDEMVFGYGTAARLCDDAIAEYERHLSIPEFATKRLMYGNHIDTLKGMKAMCGGDRDYLLAMRATGAERARLLASAAQNYRNSIREFGLTAIRYFTSDQLATAVLPPGVNRANVGTGAPGSRTAVTEEDVLQFMAGIRKLIDDRGGPQTDENGDDRKEYETYVRRALDRIDQMQQAAGAPAAAATGN